MVIYGDIVVVNVVNEGKTQFAGIVNPFLRVRNKEREKRAFYSSWNFYKNIRCTIHRPRGWYFSRGPPMPPLKPPGVHPLAVCGTEGFKGEVCRNKRQPLIE